MSSSIDFQDGSRIEFIDPDEQRLGERAMNKVILYRNKWNIVALVIVGAYLVLGMLVAGGEGVLRVILVLMTPLALLFFPDLSSRYRGSTRVSAGPILKQFDAFTSSRMVKFMGWFFLLFPMNKIGYL